MKMSKKAAAILLLVASITTGAFIYNSGITPKSGAVKMPNTEVFSSKIPEEATKYSSADKKAEVQEAPPAEQKIEAKVQAPAPKLVNSRVVTSVPKTTLASRGAVARKTTTSTTTATSTAYTTSSYRASAAERDLLARLVSAESGAESFAGKLAVATVIMNRVKSPDYPNTITGVIYDKNWGVQFTPVSDGRINDPATADSIKAANMVLDGYRSFEPKVMFFVNPSKSVNMYVINTRTYYTTIGLHKFYY